MRGVKGSGTEEGGRRAGRRSYTEWMNLDGVNVRYWCNKNGSQRQQQKPKEKEKNRKG